MLRYDRICGLALAITLPISAADQTIAFRRATIETASKAGALTDATMVVTGNKIVAIGQDAKIPENALVIDAKGKTIIPGMIDPFWRVSTSTGSPSQQTITIGGRTIVIPSQGATPLAPFVRLVDNFYPYDRQWRLPVRDGVTLLHLATNGYGQGATVRLLPGKPDDMLVSADGLLCIGVANETRSLDRVRSALDAVARVVQPADAKSAPTSEKGAAKDAPQDSPSPKGPPSGTKGPPSPPQTREALEKSASGKLWIACYEGKSPVLVTVNSAAAVAHLLTIAETHKNVKWVLTGNAENFVEVASKLKGKPVRVIIRPGIDRMPNTRERVNVARLLNENEVEVLFTDVATSPAVTPDMPLFTLAMVSKTGLPRKVAIEAVTSRPAAVLGIEKDYGSLEAGKMASFIVFDGDPFSAESRLRQVYVEGVLVHEN